MFAILKPFLDGHNVVHYTGKEDFLEGIKATVKSRPSFLSEDWALIVNAGIPVGEEPKDKDIGELVLFTYCSKMAPPVDGQGLPLF